MVTLKMLTAYQYREKGAVMNSGLRLKNTLNACFICIFCNFQGLLRQLKSGKEMDLASVLSGRHQSKTVGLYNFIILTPFCNTSCDLHVLKKS